MLFDAGDRLARASGLPLPANLVGLLLLVLLLGTGVVRPADLHESAALVARHLAFVFIPFVVGLMAWGALLAAGGALLALSLLGSAVLGIAVAGLAAQRLPRRAT
jgi:holin-like protein